MKKKDDPSIIVPDEERVEDAGLNYEEARRARKAEGAFVACGWFADCP
jgi:hypothetical protein